MSAALQRLSTQIDAVIPHLVFICFARKAVACAASLLLMLANMSDVCNSPNAVSIKRYYGLLEYRLQQVWSTCYIALSVYAVFDVFQNMDDFLNCREHTIPRPIGIFSAVALVCFVFTTKLSVSSLSIVVMYCAKDMSMMTGLAAMMSFSVWTDMNGVSVIVGLCTILAGLGWVFCSHKANALLFFFGCVWVGIWAWLSIVQAAMQTFKTRRAPKQD